MKLLLIFVFILNIFNLGFASYLDKYIKANQTCYEELDLTTKSIQEIRKQNGCLRKCILYKLKIIGEDGKPFLEKFPSHFKNIIGHCANESETNNNCTYVSNLINCIYDTFDRDLRQFSVNCGNETNTDISKFGIGIEHFVKGVGDQKRACYSRCLLQKFGFIKDEELDWKEYEEYLLDAGIKLQKLINKCDDFEAADVCIQTTQRIACIGKEIWTEKFKLYAFTILEVIEARI